jgi:Uma2 family endonuclease
VVKGELELQAGRKDTLTNPVMIAEVISQSTEGYDRGRKFAAYRTIPSFQEYIIIDQYSQYVEQFNKTETGQWLLSDYQVENEILSLVSVPWEMTIGEIYDRVNLEID